MLPSALFGNPAIRRKLFRKYTLGMEKSTKVRGKIVDDDGHPVAGAVVILQFRKKSSNPHEEIDVNGYNRNKPVKSRGWKLGFHGGGTAMKSD